MNTILISTSKFGTPIPNYFKFLGEEFRKNNFSIIFLFDGQQKNMPPNKDNVKYFTYPSKRPTKLKDFIFLCKIMKKEKPILAISNFGSTNIVTISSYIFRVPHRVNYIHTSPHQLYIDSKKSYIFDCFLKIRKIIILNMNTHFITNSNKMSELISSFFKIKINNISILPYLLEESKKNRKNFSDRENKICIVGRLELSKGHKELLRAFNECKDKHPKLMLLIIGDGPEKNNLQELTTDLGLNKHVIFSGNIPNKSINKIFSMCLASISASRSEAFGIVNIESLREGTPIICTNTEGAKDIIEHGKNGFHINLMKKYDLSERLTEIFNNWNYYSQNALKTFEKKYSKKNIIYHYQRLENELLK